ncbi:MAG: mechanosensitive ion channel domain-containing protein [Candidatus Sulfomarinibacteraceae bacterium]
MDSRHRRPPASHPGSILLSAVFVTLLAAASPVLAQSDQSAAPTSTPVPALTPIPASQIPARTGEVAVLLRGIQAKAQTQHKITAIADALPQARQMIDELENQTLPLLEDDGPPQGLRDSDVELARVERRLTEWIDALNSRTVELDGALADLKDQGELWILTLRAADAEELPTALLQQVKETIAAVQGIQKTVGERRAEVLTLQAEMASQRSRLRALRDQLADELEIRQLDLLRLDSPPLWRALGEDQEGDLGEEVLETARKNLAVLKAYAAENTRTVARDVSVFVIVLVLFVRLGRKAELWVRSDNTLKTTTALLQRPVASSLLVTIMVLGGWFKSTAPAAYLNLLGLILLLIMLRLLPHLIRQELRPAIGLLVGLTALYLVVELVPSTFFLHRAGELLMAGFGAATCGWALHRERSLADVTKDIWYWAAVWLATAAVIAFSVSVAANVVGAVAFSSILAVATVASIYDAITLWMFAVVFFGAVTVALRTTTARRLLIVRYHSDRIRAVLFRMIKIIAVLVWLASALDHYGALDWTTKTLKNAVLTEYTLGEFSLSVSSILIFVVVIWLSVKLAQLISFVLDDDVLPRLDLPKGVPATISKTSTYLVVCVGCVVAVAAAGLDLSRATILVGALGVGIGFGLQNAVNNFVSGLILLFGRPINVGDKIQIGEISGVVKDIGIRATVVQTWQGAEVIVPNATLISDNLINWTLSDTSRRMEIPVGVAYGSPTERVIELLTDVARAHPEVLEDPEPVTIFTGFGASSLDFELRAWTTGDFVVIASDLRVGIEQTLAEHEIEIPFPQRDLHLRSMEPQAADRLAGNRAGSPTSAADAGAADPEVGGSRDDRGA